MKITIETIPHNCQRYDTCGDWVFEADGSLNINVSEMFDKRSEIAVAFHEMAEALLCRHKGITAKQVDDFDMHWPATSAECGALTIDAVRTKYQEPGNDPSAPYFLEHIKAETIERLIAGMLGLGWGDHCEIVDRLK